MHFVVISYLDFVPRFKNFIQKKISTTYETSVVFVSRQITSIWGIISAGFVFTNFGNFLHFFDQNVNYEQINKHSKYQYMVVSSVALQHEFIM